VKDNVVPIRGGAVIEILEDLLQQARKGEIEAIAFAIVNADQSLTEGWSGTIDTNVVAMYGAINILRDGYFHSSIEHDGYADRQHDS